MIPVRKLLADLLEERKRIDKAIAVLEQNLRGRPKLVHDTRPERPSLPAGRHLAPEPGLGHPQLIPDALQRQSEHGGGFVGAQSGKEPKFD